MAAKQNSLESMLELEEYFGIHQMLEKQADSFLSDPERAALVEAKAALFDPHEAMILYRKFRLDRPALLAKLHALCGETSEALRVARTQNDPYLTASVQMALEKYQDAIATLAGADRDGHWYYFMGRCHGFLFEYAKAIACLRKSVKLYRERKDELRATVSLALLGTYLSANSQVREAQKVFSETESRLSRLKAAKYPQFHSRVLANLGVFHQSIGNQAHGLRLLVEADRIARKAEGSPDFFRSRIYLANALLNVGQFRHCVDLLEPLAPGKRTHRLDRCRHLMVAYAEIGEMERAQQTAEEARLVLAPGDEFGKIYLDIDEAEVLYRMGRFTDAQALCRRAMQSAESSDPVAYHFAWGRLAAMTRDRASAEATLQFHLSNGLLLEAQLDRLTIGLALILEGREQEALTYLDRIPTKDFPIQRAYSRIFSAVVGIRRGKEADARADLAEALKLTQGRNLPVQELLCLYLQLHLADSEQLEKWQELFREAQSRVTEWEIARFEAMLTDLKIRDLRRYTLARSDRRDGISHLELIRLRASKEITLVDLVEEKVFSGGKEVKGLARNPTRWKLIRLLASAWPQRVEKERLAIGVFDRKTYNPLTDDNLIYVTVNRLRKSLGSDDFIETKDGRYGIRPAAHLAVVFPLEHRELERAKLVEVLRSLLDGDSLSAAQIQKQSRLDAETIEVALEKLLRSGLIRISVATGDESRFEVNL